MASAEMATNGAFDPASSYARISERVENQGRDIVDLRSNMNTGFRNLESSIHALSTELRGNSRTQWPVIWSAVGVCFAVVVGIGSAVYIPIREGITEAKADIRANAKDALSVAAFQDFRAAYDNNRIVSRTEYIDKFGQVNSRIEKLEDRMVPRTELDHRLEDIATRVDRLERERAPPIMR